MYTEKVNSNMHNNGMDRGCGLVFNEASKECVAYGIDNGIKLCRRALA